MRYIILKKMMNSNEITERVKYIYHVFGLYCIPHEKSDYVEFISLPLYTCDLCIIIGHNDAVHEYLCSNHPSEKNLVLITCYIGKITKLHFKNDNVFISKNNGGYSDIFNGKEWNIGFNVTDSEITLYNNKDKDLDIKLSKSFERIK